MGITSVLLIRWPRIRKIFLFILVSAVIILPFSTVIRNYDINLNDPISMILLASFEDRLIHTWPDFILAVSQFGNPVTGVGFGGIGSAIKHSIVGSRNALEYADNFALYLYGCFGMLALIILIYLLTLSIKSFRSEDKISVSLASVIVFVFSASLTTDIIESQILALMLGIFLTYNRCI
jgi:hypothetical protein